MTPAKPSPRMASPFQHQPSAPRKLATHAGTAALALLLFPCTTPAQSAFRGLGVLPGGSYSNATGVSRDGAAVVGIAGYDPAGATLEAFRWTASTGIVGLGDLPGSPGPISSLAYAVSANGSVVVGIGDYNSAPFPQAFRWTAPGGMAGLGDFPGGNCISYAYGVSADGAVVAGVSSDSGGNAAFRWTASTGMVGIGGLPGGLVQSWAWAVSGDGNVIVGNGYSSSGGAQAFRWSAATGMVSLGQLPGGSVQSWARAVSADGSVIVGESSTNSGTVAFRWTAATGMVGLPAIPSGTAFLRAQGVSGDGSVVVGLDASANDAVMWDALHGSRSIKTVLQDDLGLDLTGWTLHEAAAISADGNAIVGNGTSPTGRDEAWLAVLAPPCAADFTGDGDVTVADFLAFLNLYAQGDSRCDLNHDGQVSVGDFLAFLALFAVGCG
jgi:probable HAF family extracellular repeat protein